VFANEYSWLPNGLCCFRSGKGTNSQIHLERYEKGKVEELFAKNIGKTVQYPICLTNGVIAVDVDGVVGRLNLTGDYVFMAKPKGFEGLSATSGKLDDNHIFMTETVSNKEKNGLLYHLYVVDISGTEPTLKTEFNIIPPLRITLTMKEIVVVGETNVLRLKIP
jgi:hypothetical protein